MHFLADQVDLVRVCELALIDRCVLDEGQREDLLTGDQAGGCGGVPGPVVAGDAVLPFTPPRMPQPGAGGRLGGDDLDGFG